MNRPTLPDAPSRPAIPAPIRHGRVIAIARGMDPGRLLDTAAAIADTGPGGFEVTLNSEGAMSAIAALARAALPGLAIGAGTVLTQRQAEAALDAGARFLVMPVTDAALVAWAAARGVPTFPGALTPTELLAAWTAGASAVKLFPASAVTPAYLREIHGPLPEIALVPTGGITAETAPRFLEAGAVAVAVGGWLAGTGDPETVAARARELAAAVRPWRLEPVAAEVAR